jgi:hypothetical protein
MKEIIQRLDDQDEAIDDIKNNHLHGLKLDLSVVKTDVKWLKKLIVPVLIASVAGLIAQIFK